MKNKKYHTVGTITKYHTVETITKYHKYLGIIFKPSGSFLYATDQLSKKACKAMFCIQKSLLSDNMNIYGHIKLFNACVQPILLYCSEVWSLFTNNCFNLLHKLSLSFRFSRYAWNIKLLHFEFNKWIQ
jgi:hypothetical protein